MPNPTARTPSPRNLWHDARTFRARLALILPVALGTTLTFLLFGMLDLFLRNHNSMPFFLSEIIAPFALTWLIASVVLCAMLTVLRGRVLDIALSLLLGVLVAGYLQGTFLNLPLGQLNGSAVPWDDYRAHAVFNLLLWQTIMLLPLVLWWLSRSLWQRAMLLIPLVLVGMQLAGLVGTLATADKDIFQARKGFLSEQGLYEVSTKDNILVFVLDRMDALYIDGIRNDGADYFDDLEGFTYYRDNTSMYARTFPSVPYMLTGKLCFFDTTPSEYMRQAYAESPFLPTLREAGYTTKLYIQEKYSYGDLSQITGLADNIDPGSVALDVPLLMQQMGLLTANRFMPHALKASFWLPSNAFDALRKMPVGQAPYQMNDYRFYQGLLRNRLTTQSEKGNFLFLHLNGSHPAYELSDEAERVPQSESDELTQTRGCFHMLREYFNQMKALGLYDDATIVITGDHGETDTYTPLSTYKTTAFFYKPKGSAGVPLDYSDAPISHANLQATLIQAAGLDPAAFGRPVEDVAEGDGTVRDFYYRVDEQRPGGQRCYLEHFKIHDYAENFDNCEKSEDIEFPDPDI